MSLSILKTYQPMKTIAIYGLVVASLMMLSIKVEAAVTEPHAAVKEGHSEHDSSRDAQKVVSAKSHHTSNSSVRVDERPAVTAADGVLSKAESVHFYAMTTAANKKFSAELEPVKACADHMQTELYIHPPGGGLQVRAPEIKEELKIVIKTTIVTIAKVEGDLARLLVVHEIGKAVRLCRKIRTEALKLEELLATAEQKGMLSASEQKATTRHLKNLSSNAEIYSQRFQALGAASR